MKKLKFEDIKDFDYINDPENDVAKDIFESIINYGWKEESGPILVYQGRLLTGTHRLYALKELFKHNPEHYVFQQYIAWDMTEEIHKRIDDEPEDELLEKSYEIFDFSEGLGKYLEGTPVEKYKEHIREW